MTRYPPPPMSSQNIESKERGKLSPCKIFHPKELQVKIFDSKGLIPENLSRFWHGSTGGINQSGNGERFSSVHDPLIFQRSLAQPRPSSPEWRAEETLGLQAECIAFLADVKLRKYMYHCMG